MVEVNNFSEAWDAYLAQHQKPPANANQLQKYSAHNKEISEIAYPIAKLQFEYNSKIEQSAQYDAPGDSNDIATELERLQKQTGDKYQPMIDRHFYEFGSTFGNKTNITLMQYNVTLDTLIAQQKGKQNEEKEEKAVPAEHWQYRGYRIIEIIKEHEPDIITMQELNHYKFMCHFLKPLGYEGVFKLNTKSKLLEGVAIFYKAAYFKHVTTFMYGKDVQPKLKFDLWAISVVLVHSSSDKAMVVCSANLNSKDKPALRLEKLQHLLTSCKEISSNHKDAAIFIGCDLGGDQWGAEWSAIKDGDAFIKQNKDVPKDYESGFGLNLDSAYYPSNYKGKGGKCEPQSTMFKGKTRDYIFYDQEKGVSCSTVLALPIEKVVNEFKKYPNYRNPSVHFPLMAKLWW